MGLMASVPRTGTYSRRSTHTKKKSHAPKNPPGDPLNASLPETDKDFRMSLEAQVLLLSSLFFLWFRPPRSSFLLLDEVWYYRHSMAWLSRLRFQLIPGNAAGHEGTAQPNHDAASVRL